MSEYTAELRDLPDGKGRVYFVLADGEPLLTPGGKPIISLYKNLITFILYNLKDYGYERHTIDEVIYWHITTIDKIGPMPKEEVIKMLEACLNVDDPSVKDWGLTSFENDAFMKRIYLGNGNRIEEIHQWLLKCTKMQLCAAYCLWKEYKSVDLAYVLAALVENLSANVLLSSSFDYAFQTIADSVPPEKNPSDLATLKRVLLNFKIYYGIHVKEGGPKANNKEIMIVKPEDDEILVGKAISEEDLIARNYYHYTKYVMDENQPANYDFPDFKLALSKRKGKKRKLFSDKESEEDNDGCFRKDMWIKRIPHKRKPYICYLLIVTLKDGVVDESFCKEEETQSMGYDSFYGMTSGSGSSTRRYFETVLDWPAAVKRERDRLLEKRLLKGNFSFVGKRLPQAMIEEGGNGGSKTDYTYSLRSAYRDAYMHMDIDTTEDGIIKSLSYTSYESSGDMETDLFSRPDVISDREDEAKDMLLYILDQYTNDEMEKYTVGD